MLKGTHTVLVAIVVAPMMAIAAGQPAVAHSARAAAGNILTQEPAITGRVLHADLPVPGATVTVTRGDRSAATTTDENGAFRFAGLESGAWTITIEMRGFASFTREVTIPFGASELAVTLTMRTYDEIVDPAGSANAWPASEASAGGSAKAAEGDSPGEAPTILSGSLTNGAAARFAQPRAMGNNRPRPPALYTGAFTTALGNSAWNAQPYAFGGTPAVKPEYADTQFGINVGGPFRIPFVIKHGPMTQVTYQHGVRHNANAVSGLVPTMAQRGGDFSGVAPIRDPRTGQPFADNIIPTDRIVPQASALLAYYPAPNGDTSTGANFQRPIVSDTTSDNVNVSMSRNLDPRTQLSGSFTYARSVGDSVNLFDFTDRTQQSSFGGSVSMNREISRRMSVRASYQFTSADSHTTPFFANHVNVSGDAGIAGNDQDPLNWGPPTIAFPDVADLRDGIYQLNARSSHVIGGEVRFRKGGHNITFGGDARLNRLDLLTQTDPRGTVSFTGAATGSALADFMLGLPAASAIAFGNSSARVTGGLYDAYINDDFHFGPGLTFNVGLRWEYESPYGEHDRRLANLDVAPGFADVALVTGSDPVGPLTGMRYPSALVRADWLGFEPRVAISWRPNLSSSLVIKGGYGLYRNLGVYQSIGTLLAQQPPFSSAFNVQNTLAVPLSLANPFPAAIASATTFAVNPDFTTALLHSWQITVQRDLPASLTVLGGYFGDRGTHLGQAFLPNTYPRGVANPCPACPSGFSYLTSGGRSTRHAAQLMVRRRLYAGFMSTVTYTFAKAMDDASTFSNTSVSPQSLSVAQDWTDLHAEWGPSSFDQRHLVSVDVQYSTGMGLTGGTLVDGFWGALFKDWTLTARYNAGSGMPLTPLYAAVIPGTGIVGVRPSLTGVPIAPLEPGTYANPAAFAAPASGAWGTAGRNSIRGPGTSSFDMTLARAFRLHKRKTLEWRLAATNVFNRVVFSSIDRSVTSPQFGRPNAANQMRRIETLFKFGL